MKKRPHLVPNIVASSMLLIAVAPMPYEYYGILRWAICLAALNIESIGVLWREHGTWWVAIVFGFVAILFNPINQADLPRTAWIPIDLVVSALFGYTAFAVTKSPDETYGIVEITGGLFAAAWFTALAFGGLLLLRELLMVFR